MSRTEGPLAQLRTRVEAPLFGLPMINVSFRMGFRGSSSLTCYIVAYASNVNDADDGDGANPGIMSVEATIDPRLCHLQETQGHHCDESQPLCPGHPKTPNRRYRLNEEYQVRRHVENKLQISVAAPMFVAAWNVLLTTTILANPGTCRPCRPCRPLQRASTEGW